MKHYLLITVGGLKPEVHGPFATAEERDAAAKSHWKQDPEANDGLFRLDVDADGQLKGGVAFTTMFFETSYSTQCPKCGVDGKLSVVEAVFSDGKLTMNSPLYDSGFDVPLTAKDPNTDEEVVECGECGKRFPLSDVTL